MVAHKSHPTIIANARCGRLGTKETNIMKRVFGSPDTAQLNWCKIMLEKAGIRGGEINEQLAQTIPVAPFQAELWVALLAAWPHSPPASGAGWCCSRCGESLGDQLTQCWKCGTSRREDGLAKEHTH
jgi:hypothetical protein